ncbi:MAG: carboxypeptidase regulatory-like domain-containing protein [Planctomycetes bacterium]|nr:carboxypeptidase regulatory-like domain-containing protein [Planctomycetota bacterium]MCW8135280.1 carboxypeptidase regulatory-like domain-containing protein [Planctomycetota bacterium]
MGSGAKVLLGAVAGVVVVALLLLLTATVKAPGEGGNAPRVNRPDRPKNKPVDPVPQPEPDPEPEPPRDPLPGPLLGVMARVRVLLPDLSPAVGATVNLRALVDRHDLPWSPEHGPRWDERGEATTDAQGRAELDVSLKTDSNGTRLVQAGASLEGWALCRSVPAIVSIADHSPLLTIMLRPAVQVRLEVHGGGAPVAGARVLVGTRDGSVAARDGTTGDDGAWAGEIADEVELPWVLVCAPGFAHWHRQLETAALQRIELTTTGGIEGRVVDAAGKPVPFAHVAVRALKSSGNSEGPSPELVPVADGYAAVTTMADARGRFLVEHVRHGPGDHRVTVVASGFAPEWLDLFVNADDIADAGQLTLKRAFDQPLTVKDPLGRPVRDARIRLMPRAPELAGWAIDRFVASADAAGKATLAGVWQGEWTLNVHAAGYARYQADFSPGAPAEIQLAAGGGLTGTLLDWKKQPVASALVVIVGAKDTRFLNWGAIANIEQWHIDTPHPPVRAGSDGLFRFADLPVGEYAMLAVDSEHRTTLVRDDIVVHPGAVIDLGPNTFPARTDLLVRVRRDGKPLPRVAFETPSGEVLRTDEYGLLRLTNQKPGQLLLRLEGETLLRYDARFAARRVTASEGELTDTVLELPGAGFGAIQGEVSFAGQPRAGQISLRGARAEYTAIVMRDGRYSLPSVAAGEYEAEVSLLDGMVVRQALEISEGSATLDIAVAPGVVRGSVGRQERSGQVRAMSVDVPGAWIGAVVGSDGQFRFELPPGRWKVHAMWPGAAGVAEVVVAAGSESVVEIALAPAGEAVFRVGKLLPANFSGASTARLICADGTPYPGLLELEGKAGAEAHFACVMPGEYTLEVRGAALQYLRGITIEAGALKEASLELQAPASLEIELAGADAEAVAQALVRMTGFEGAAVKPPAGRGVPVQKGERTLLVPDIMPDVRQVIIEVPGFEPATVAIDFKAGAAVTTRVALKKAP